MLALVAHGLGGRTDLPLPTWMFSYGAGAALVLSFVALGALWRQPLLTAAARGRSLPGALQAVARPGFLLTRAFGLLAFAVTLAAAIWGPDSAANFAPVTLCIVFWVGLFLVSPLLGDVFWAINPFDTIARVTGAPIATTRRDPGRWTAAVLLFSFVWLELAYYDGCSDPRAVAVWLLWYSLAVTLGAHYWGRRWLRHGEGFAAVFGLVAAIAPIHRDDEGHLRVRAPLAGLAAVDSAPGTPALVLVALGSTTFDGFTRTELWDDVIGTRTTWDYTIVTTIGLAWIIAVVALAYYAAVHVASRALDRTLADTADSFVASLVPIVLAYTIAHYFSLLLFEGQLFLALVSDPLGRGWDLFGSFDRTIDYSLLSYRAISYVQVVAIVVGHIAGVAAAHDRAIEIAPRSRATASQYPLLAVMVLYTIGGLTILLQS